MLISEYLAGRNSISVTTGSVQSSNVKKTNEKGESSFARALEQQLSGREVEFSNHAIRRLESRKIDVSENDKLERLNRGVEIAADKGSSETLVLVDKTAFVVSVKNNKVITTLSDNELQGNVFTNIDSTVIV